MNDNGKKPPLIAVVGATATGKTALGVALAAEYGGEVISADSMQLYEGLDIATAKPTAEEMQGIPHHLISVLPPEQPCSVADYAEMARAAVADVLSRGKLPILVGGTGLYADALLDNIQFPDIPASPELRAQLNNEAAERGNAAMLERLRECDPETAERLHENNLRRIVRALEVYTITGIPLSEHARRSRAVPPMWEVLRVGIGFRDRALHRARICLRVDEMLARGLLEEVRAEYESGRRLATASAAIGYKELLPYLRQEASLQACVDAIKLETGQYAKRQETWFRRNAQTNWIYRDEIRENDGILLKCRKIIAKWNYL